MAVDRRAILGGGFLLALAATLSVWDVLSDATRGPITLPLEVTMLGARAHEAVKRGSRAEAGRALNTYGSALLALSEDGDMSRPDAEDLAAIARDVRILGTVVETGRGEVASDDDFAAWQALQGLVDTICAGASYEDARGG